ncbi:MAG: M15 family metallopeptidase [Oscillospiraceae bacterium]|nr:M15 family metallopeptidase [Oscillospiraceae bacterium]
MKKLRCAAVLLAALMILTSAVQAEGAAPETPAPQAAAAAPAEQAAPRAEDWQLLLVNPWNTLPEDFTVELQRLSNGMQADKRIVEDLNAMLTACRKAGLRPVICSAYRPLETQARLYNNKIARLRAAGYSRENAVKEAGRWVAVPGTSEHQTGLALDIVAASYQVLDKRQEETAEQKWLMEHCWEYGFILRYPSDKSEITGIGYEPWHYRYVGRETALAIRDSGLCFEEYLKTLEDQETKPETKQEAKQETAKAVSCLYASKGTHRHRSRSTVPSGRNATPSASSIARWVPGA